MIICYFSHLERWSSPCFLHKIPMANHVLQTVFSAALLSTSVRYGILYIFPTPRLQVLYLTVFILKFRETEGNCNNLF